MGPNHRRAPAKVLLMALLAGCTFGSLFVILGHTSDDSGLWPVFAMRVTSVPYMLIVMYVTGNRVRHIGAQRKFVIGSGILDTVANALYLARRTSWIDVHRGNDQLVLSCKHFATCNTTRQRKDSPFSSRGAWVGCSCFSSDNCGVNYWPVAFFTTESDSREAPLKMPFAISDASFLRRTS
jgi:hypothetical protein